jgi:hypothetical protein
MDGIGLPAEFGTRNTAGFELDEGSIDVYLLARKLIHARWNLSGAYNIIDHHPMRRKKRHESGAADRNPEL